MISWSDLMFQFSLLWWINGFLARADVISHIRYFRYMSIDCPKKWVWSFAEHAKLQILSKLWYKRDANCQRIPCIEPFLTLLLKALDLTNIIVNVLHNQFFSRNVILINSKKRGSKNYFSSNAQERFFSK